MMNKNIKDHHKKTILHIDDDKNILDIVRLMLRDKHYNLISELQGSKTVERALCHRPDLIILDIMMPEKSGFELIKQIREHPEIHDIPIMVLSVSNSESKCLKLGADFYMSKPMDEHDLITAIDRLVNRQQS